MLVMSMVCGEGEGSAVKKCCSHYHFGLAMKNVYTWQNCVKISSCLC